LIDEEDDFLEKWVHWALWALAAIVVVATVTGLVESYNGLYIWFATHHITGFWADWAPLTVDSFTVIGELSIFAGISRHWDWKSRVLPWVSAMIGIGSSVAANVGDKVQFHSLPTDLTGAIFPLAGAFGIVIGLGVLKRIAKDVKAKKVAKKGETPDDVIDQLTKENKELTEALTELKSVSVIDISPEEEPEPVKEQELKGMDILIPPKTEESVTWPEISQPATQPTPATALFAEPQPVSREEARRRQSLRPDRGTIYQTGSFPAIS
jgi:hypothetical protein